ncbi:MAG: metal-dependent hydrolase [Saprospiraceae bacterium]|nr:metal-dependent hydrolase [Candidatus Brachybacter algidus]
MPSAFSHAFVAIAIGSSSDRIRIFKILLIGSICAAIPDLDAIGFQMGIPYDSLFGHRGITHSFFFSFFLALLGHEIIFHE